MTTTRQLVHDEVKRARTFWRTYLRLRAARGPIPNAINNRETALKHLGLARELSRRH